MLEEACALILARGSGVCLQPDVRSRQQGPVLVRPCWRADFEVNPWEPRFEIRYRRLGPACEAAEYLREPHPVANRVSYRALHEAGVQTAGG